MSDGLQFMVSEEIGDKVFEMVDRLKDLQKICPATTAMVTLELDGERYTLTLQHVGKVE